MPLGGTCILEDILLSFKWNTNSKFWLDAIQLLIFLTVKQRIRSRHYATKKLLYLPHGVQVSYIETPMSEKMISSIGALYLRVTIEK